MPAERFSVSRIVRTLMRDAQSGIEERIVLPLITCETGSEASWQFPGGRNPNWVPCLKPVHLTNPCLRQTPISRNPVVRLWIKSKGITCAVLTVQPEPETANSSGGGLAWRRPTTTRYKSSGTPEYVPIVPMLEGCVLRPLTSTRHPIT